MLLPPKMDVTKMGMKEKSPHSQALDLLRFPLAIVVLTSHTLGNLLQLSQGFSIPVFHEISYFIYGFFSGQSVPIYYFISGYVFFLGIELTREKYFRKLKNRVHTLLIPYLLWNSLFIIRAIVVGSPYFSQFVTGYESLDLTIPHLLWSFWNNGKGIRPRITSLKSFGIYPIDYPLWFVRDLMIVVLIAPFIWHMAKRFGNMFVIVSGALWFILSGIPMGHANQLSTAFFFFSWGACMSIRGKDMTAEFGRYFRISAILYLMLGLGYVASIHLCPELTTTLKSLNKIAGLVFAYNMSAWMLRHGHCHVTSFLVASSFFIYVSHRTINSVILKTLFFAVKPSTDFAMICVFVSTLIICVGALLGIFYLMRRFMPSVLYVLTGRK